MIDPDSGEDVKANRVKKANEHGVEIELGEIVDAPLYPSQFLSRSLAEENQIVPVMDQTR